MSVEGPTVRQLIKRDIEFRARCGEAGPYGVGAILRAPDKNRIVRDRCETNAAAKTPVI